MKEILLQWGGVALAAIVAWGAVEVIRLIRKYADVARAKIREHTLIENEAVESLLDRLALKAVDYAEKVGIQYIEETNEKLSSGQKLAAAKAALKEDAEKAGLPLGEAEADRKLERAHTAMTTAADFAESASSTSESASTPTEPEPN